MPQKKKVKKYVPKPYEQMTHPGERIQIDVKVVPRKCIADELLENLQQNIGRSVRKEFLFRRVIAPFTMDVYGHVSETMMQNGAEIMQRFIESL